MKRLSAILLAMAMCSVCILVGGNAFAITFNFTSQNSGPGNPLVIDGITVTPWSQGKPATVQGVGLGNDLVGSPGYLDGILSFGPGPVLNSATGGDGVNIQVNGAIHSFTIDNVYMKEETSAFIPGAFMIPFQIGYYGNNVAWGGPIWEYVDPIAGTPYTFTMPNGVPPVEKLLIMNASNFDPSPDFLNWLALFNYPLVTFTYGFTITSIDYTPAQSVPEMGTMLLLCSGIIGCAGLRWRFRR